MINAFVKKQQLTIIQPMIASETIDYLEAQFLFKTPDWDNLSKWAHFKQGETVYSVLLIDDKIPKSAHLNLSAGDWEVYLHGTSETGMRITTEVRKITVIPSGALNGLPLGEIPLSVAEQIEQKVNNATKIAQSVRDDADSGKFNGAQGKSGKTPQKGVDYWTQEDENKLEKAVQALNIAQNALNLAMTNEEDIRINEVDITELNTYAVMLEEARISDANLFLDKFGYARTSDTTKNLPTSGADAWGIILFLMENSSGKVGTQIFYPVAGAKKGTVWIRTHNQSTFSNWVQLVTQTEIDAVKTTADNAFSLAQTNEHDIGLNETSITELQAGVERLTKEIEALKQQIAPKGL